MVLSNSGTQSGFAAVACHIVRQDSCAQIDKYLVTSLAGCSKQAVTYSGEYQHHQPACSLSVGEREGYKTRVRSIALKAKPLLCKTVLQYNTIQYYLQD
jgi:hypothetical protein